MVKEKILITGAGGQLGVDLIEHFEEKGYIVYGLSRSELDVTDGQRVIEVMRELNPDVVIHSGAYTNVDQAEADPEQAYRINGYGTRNIAIASEAIGAKLVYVSTDYVFDGSGNTPYDEFKSVSPVNVYGRSKWMGEVFVEKLHTRYFITRTSWVYGQHGHNFVNTMLKLGSEKNSISVVNDQIGCPTYTKDLAVCIGLMIETNKYGTYHVSNSGHCSWYEFAMAIFRLAQIDIDILPVTSEQFQRPATRPAYSVFNHMALRMGDFPRMRSWEEALEEYLISINNVQVQV